MKVYRTIKIKLYPNRTQRKTIEKICHSCIKLWNMILSEMIDYHKKTGALKIVNIKEMIKGDKQFDDVDILALHNVQFEVEDAFKQSIKKGKYPLFMSSKRPFVSYTTTNKFGGFEVFEKHLKIKKLGKVRAVISMDIGDISSVSSITIRKNADDTYYALLTVCRDIEVEKKEPLKIVGLDYKSDGLYVSSDGDVGTNHKYYRESEMKIAKIQRELERKCGGVKGQPNSKNYDKQLKKLNKAFNKVKNQRKDNLHKLSTEIANNYDVVVVEDISMTQIVEDKRMHLGKSTYDNGYYNFVSMLDYKLKERGKKLLKINRYFPSTKKCSGCGKLKEMNISDRVYECSNCGLIIDRDLNAAINIKKEGERILGIR